MCDSGSGVVSETRLTNQNPGFSLNEIPLTQAKSLVTEAMRAA